jgi:acyl-CoA thioesterase-1
LNKLHSKTIIASLGEIVMGGCQLKSWKAGLAAAISFLMFVGSGFPVTAAPVHIVALGASNTAGKGVGTQAAWPAQLEAMLKARGYDVRVDNAGVCGDDTGRMLGRIQQAVPEGTRIVILDKAASNDRLRGVNTDGNIERMQAYLRGRHIVSIVISGMHGWAQHQLQPDGIHITAAGHHAVAARLAPSVISVIQKSQ